MTATTFTPLAALAGGALIGLAAVAMMALVGKIAGISGVLSGLLPPREPGTGAGRLAFVVGLIAAPLVTLLTTGHWPSLTIEASPALLILAGLLVGFGSVWGGGCTSGHGVCGLSRLSRRSIVATGVFMATAMAAVFVLRRLGGGL
jgi:uncharacterized membrane protein YedE/YeeE